MDISIIASYVVEILPYLATLVVTCISFLICRIQSKDHKEKEKILTEQLERAKSHETYIKCPKCGEKIPLSEVNFFLPGDVRDNNLNGIDDNAE